MKRVFRIIILIIVLFGILGLARNQVAWAANPSGETDPTGSQLVDKSNSATKEDDCEKPSNKNKAKCKEQEKEKDKCKKNKKNCGSVKPPPWNIIITVTGDYSVGGFCTLSITLIDPTIKLESTLMTLLPGKLPDRVQKISQGCLLTYYSSNKRINKLPEGSADTIICFAATPNKQMTVYFYNLYEAHSEWISLETTLEAGTACSPANASGVYVATFLKP